MLARGLLLVLALAAVSASEIQFEIFEPQAGQEYAKDQEIVLSFQGTGWPKNDKRADLLLNKKKLRDLPLPKKDGEVFNVTLTGVKKGRHEFEVGGPCTGMLICTWTPSRNLACLREGYPTLRSHVSGLRSPHRRTIAPSSAFPCREVCKAWAMPASAARPGRRCLVALAVCPLRKFRKANTYQ